MAKVRELTALIYSQFDSEAAFARSIGWDRRKLNKITTGAKEPDLHESATIADGLGISIERIADIFLHRKSPNEQRAAG